MRMSGQLTSTERLGKFIDERGPQARLCEGDIHEDRLVSLPKASLQDTGPHDSERLDECRMNKPSKDTP